jgi:hypothetical protein
MNPGTYADISSGLYIGAVMDNVSPATLPSFEGKTACNAYGFSYELVGLSPQGGG